LGTWPFRGHSPDAALSAFTRVFETLWRNPGSLGSPHRDPYAAASGRLYSLFSVAKAEEGGEQQE
jgi:hypothetical protein